MKERAFRTDGRGAKKDPQLLAAERLMDEYCHRAYLSTPIQREASQVVEAGDLKLCGVALRALRVANPFRRL